MENSMTKEEIIEQLEMVYDNLVAVDKIEKKIEEEKKKLINVNAKVEEYKKDLKIILPFKSSYEKLEAEYNKPKNHSLSIINNVFLTIYIILGVFLVGFSVVSIVLGVPNSGDIFLGIYAFEPILIGVWIIGGFLLHWFRD